MRQKSDDRSCLLVLAGLVGLVIVLGLVMHLADRRTQRTALPSEEPAAALNEASVPSPTLEIAPKPVTETMNPNIRILNGVRVTAGQFLEREEYGYTTIEVCFDFPDDRDWSINTATLWINEVAYPLRGGAAIKVIGFPRNGEQTILVWEGGLTQTTRVPASEAQTPGRCDWLLFDLIEMEYSTATLEIESIWAYPREGEVCSTAYLEKYQFILDAHQTGITVGCIQGEGMAGVQVVGKPEALSMEAAQATLTSPEIVNEVQSIFGPWIFDFSLDP